MSRPKTEINPIRAERLNTLIKRLKITQQELADRSFHSQQNISRIINLKCALTEETARAIIKAADRIVDERQAAQAGITIEEYGNYSTFRIEWLLGYDDAMTVDDWISSAHYQQDVVAQGIWGMIEKSLSKQGKSLKFVHRQDQLVHAYQRARSDCYYEIVDQDGTVLKTLTAVELIQFEKHLQEYCDFLTERHLLK